MIGRLNHVAIAVKDLAAATAVYRDTLGAVVTAPMPQPEHGVTVVFITLPNTKIELLEPLGEGSPIAKFLDKSPDGGIHHVCYEVDDIIAARDKLKAQGARVLGDGNPKIGRARQAGAVPASERLPRHAGRAGASLTVIGRGAHRSLLLFPPPLRGRVREGGIHNVWDGAPPPSRPSPIKGEGEELGHRLVPCGGRAWTG